MKNERSKRAAKRKRAQPQPSLVGAVNPYSVQRRAAMMSKRVQVKHIHEACKDDVSASTVGFVIDGTFRNDVVMSAFVSLVGGTVKEHFPDAELEWREAQRAAEKAQRIA